MKMMGLARLGRDAELRFTNDGTAVANLALAVNYGRKDPNTGERPTQWVEASIWGKQAEAVSQYLSKGSLHNFYLSDVHVETYQKNDGSQGVKMVARVDDVELGPRAGQGDSQPRQQPTQQRNSYAEQKSGRAPEPRAAQNFSDMDEDIPF